MIVLVCGSRDWTAWQPIMEALSALGPGVEVIHGNARGADRLAANAATKLDLPCRAFNADWRTHGKRAGILRNLQMLDECPDLVLAFQIGASRGTQHTVDEALRRGIRVVVERR